MKKDTLFLIIAALTLFITWRMFRLNKKTTEKQTKTTTTDPDPLDILGDNPNDEAETTETVEILTEKVTYEDCPYCGTPNARILRVIDQNGKVVKKKVECGNKSCPGMGGKIQTKVTTTKFVETR